VDILYRQLRCVCLAVAALIGCAAAPAGAQGNYPSQYIRIIVGYAAGGNTDVPARLFATEMSKMFGVPVVVENRPGASGVPAAQFVSKSAPDGHTLVWGTSASHSVPVATMPNLPFDPITDFAPITLISMDPNVIVGSPAFPADSLDALLANLKANPRTPIGTSGPATSGRFAVELMKPKLGTELTIVPYKSTGPLLIDLAAGHIPLGIMGASIAVPLINEKKIRAFAVTSLKRSKVLPDIPTFNETVSPGFEAVAWSALYAPPGTPEPIVAKLNATMRQIAQLPEIKRWFDDSGLEVPMGSPRELTEFMKADISKWVQVAKDNNIKIDQQ
jgi:tripartite-type tricarboxylate transporter receptor subunit TctC